MVNAGFESEWINLAERDPYAAVGISVTAEDRRILKRYRQVAKLLHPDSLAGQDETTKAFANQVLSRVINPAYQRLKQEKTRSESLATMRFRVRRLARTDQLHPTFESAKQLLRIPEAEIEVFYENALTQLAENQFDSPNAFSTALEQLSQLNNVFLRRKMGDVVIREKRRGLMAATPAMRSEVETPEPDPPEINYAEKYGIRARAYLNQQNYEMAIQELREALKLEPNNAEYHSMLGQAYFVRKQYGMAKAHLKRASQLNPNHPIIRKYLEKIEKIQPGAKKSSTGPKNNGTRPMAKSPSLKDPRSSWLGRLFGKQ
ncbi:MAG: tetratricopeptide repeat protein [Cyanobacteria bacterium P01_D01_bin.44]